MISTVPGISRSTLCQFVFELCSLTPRCIGRFQLLRLQRDTHVLNHPALHPKVPHDRFRFLRQVVHGHPEFCSTGLGGHCVSSPLALTKTFSRTRKSRCAREMSKNTTTTSRSLPSFTRVMSRDNTTTLAEACRLGSSGRCSSLYLTTTFKRCM